MSQVPNTSISNSDVMAARVKPDAGATQQLRAAALEGDIAAAQTLLREDPVQGEALLNSLVQTSPGTIYHIAQATVPAAKADPSDASWTKLATPPASANMAAFGDRQNAVEDVLADIRSEAPYNALGPQDKGAGGAESLWNREGRAELAGGRDARDLRNDTTPQAWSMSPRRQTEDVPGKLLGTLAASPRYNDIGRSTYNTVVLDTHRINQFPEQYLGQIAAAAKDGKQVMVAASIGGSANDAKNGVLEKATAERDLRMLDNTLKLLKAAGVSSDRITVVAGQADTPFKDGAQQTPERKQFVAQLRTDTANTYNKILERNGLAAQKVNAAAGLPWGGDELASTAIAGALPSRSVNVVVLDKDGKAANPGEIANRWENNDSTRRLITEALDKNNLTQSKPGEKSDLTLYVVVDKSGGRATQPGNPGLPYQGHPESIRHRIEQDFADNKVRPNQAMVVDLRTTNGAFDNAILPRNSKGEVNDGLLATGAWGTGANSLGQTLAIGKVMNATGNVAARRQMLMESVANDFILRNHHGTKDVKGTAVDQALQQSGVTPDWNSAGKIDLSQKAKATQVLDQYVDRELKRLFGSTASGVDTTLQFSRLFEAHFQLNGGPLGAHLTRGR